MHSSPPSSSRIHRLFVFATASLLSGCLGHHRTEAPAPLRSPDRDSLLAADAARGEAATRLGLAAAAAGWLDSAIVYLRSGASIEYGRDAALTVAAAGAPDRATYAWRPLGGAVSRDGHDGYTYGIAATSVPNADGPPTMRLDRYLAFWRRGLDGVWRISAYADVGGPPPPAGTPLPSADLRPSRSLPRGPRADAVRRVREADSAFALAADLQGTGVAFAAYVAPHGAVFAGSELIVGMAAVRAFYDEQQRAGGTLNWRPVYADASDSGDLGMTVGEYVFTGRGTSGAVVQRFGKYLTIWQRKPGGEWRFVIDGGNPSPTPNR
jgi:ketosteroid isomerase-like protein